MDGGPRWLLRAVQLGLRDEVLRNSTPWLCLFCATCQARCPAKIDIPMVMETMRLMAVAENIKPAKKEVALFQRLFLSQVSSLGRVYELGLGGAYNLRSGHLLANLSLVPRMLAKGRLSLIPHRNRDCRRNRRLKSLVTQAEREGKAE